MRLRFALWGNSLAVRIPRAAAREVAASAGGIAELTVRDGKLVIEPVNETPHYDLDELLNGITPENLHGETDWGDDVGEEIG
ncbi:MAG TPA: AbrB/MazE/SpoVT family DNA-binding domain-containing protein [Beijerinckiaceae bacterium]|nr:AbrB/MazE/SpoVT family DNA-binding domain-containing protein [Beijerinckiaceae bacterium]